MGYLGHTEGKDVFAGTSQDAAQLVIDSDKAPLQREFRKAYRRLGEDGGEALLGSASRFQRSIQRSIQ
jgi:hypothetical protein